MKQRRGAAACTTVEEGEKGMQHVSVRRNRHERAGDSAAAAGAIEEQVGKQATANASMIDPAATAADVGKSGACMGR